MNLNNNFKNSIILILMLLSFNALVAQDKITFSWKSSHGDGWPSGGDLVIRATDGEEFTIDWGDSTAIETKTGLGNTNIPLRHEYYNWYYGNVTVTIAALNTNCKFTYFDCHTFFEDDVTGFQLTSLALEGCSDLEYLYCDYNSLQLSDLYAAQLVLKEQSGRLFGTQYLPYQPLTGGMTVDFSEQRIIGGVETFFQVSVGWTPALFNIDYTIDNGIITFINEGKYYVTMTNGAILPHPNYPVSVVAGYDLIGVNVLENPLPHIKIYPNPTSNILYIQTESETIPELKFYSLEDRFCS